MARKPWLSLFALLAAPIAAAAIVGIVAGLHYTLTLPQTHLDNPEGIVRNALAFAPLAALVAAYFALPASLTFGWLVHSVLRQRQITGLRWYVLGAVLVGIPLQIIGLFSIPDGIVFWGLPVAALSGCFLWLIRRPDRDAANPDTRAP